MKAEILAASYHQTYEEKLPNYICDSVFDLANAFNVFYGSCKILGEPDPQKKTTWIALSKAVGNLLAQTLDVLGIDTVKAM